jgi:hypothetical protein
MLQSKKNFNIYNFRVYLKNHKIKARGDNMMRRREVEPKTEKKSKEKKKEEHKKNEKKIKLLS